MDDQNAQEDEILALKSIYEENDLFSFNETTKSGKFYAKTELSDSKVLTINFSKLISLVNCFELNQIN